MNTDQEKSLLSAIEGSYERMSHSDLVMTCNMLSRGRTAWQREYESQKLKSEKLWNILVMLKRDLDSHVTNPNKLELTKQSWYEAVKRAEAVR